MNQNKLSRLFSALDFVPITSFVICYKMELSWDMCFTIAGAIGLFFLLTHFLFFKKKLSPPFLLGVNLFLIGGLFMATCKIGWLTFLYNNLKQATLFISMTLVALLATIFEPDAFLDSGLNPPADCKTDTRTARKLSLIMLAGCVLATIGSFYLKGDNFYAGYLPFLFLIFLKDGIQVCDYGIKKKLYTIFGTNFLILFISFAGKKLITQGSFVSIVILLAAKKVIRKSVKKFF